MIVLVIFQTARRATHFALERPAREVLFTRVSREDKYKSKNIIDTVVYRAGDAVSGWLYSGLGALGLALSGTSLVAVPVSALSVLTALYLARAQPELKPLGET